MGLRPLAQLTRGGRGGTRPGGPAQAGAPRPRPSKQGRRHAPHCHHPGQLRAVARRGCALRAPNGRRQAPAQTGPIRHREGQGPASGSPESPANLAGGRLPVRSPASLRQRHARPVAPQGSALQGTARCRHLPSRDHPASARSVAAAASRGAPPRHRSRRTLPYLSKPVIEPFAAPRPGAAPGATSPTRPHQPPGLHAGARPRRTAQRCRQGPQRVGVRPRRWRSQRHQVGRAAVGPPAGGSPA